MFPVRPILSTLVLSLLAVSIYSQAGAQSSRTGASGFPVPRFVSLKSDLINVRRGPGRDHQIAWIFLKAGLPVEIIQEYDNWRRVRDSEGAEGWIFHSLLSGRRTALIQPWKPTDLADLHTGPDTTDPIAAQIESKVLASVGKCDGNWCSISGPDWSGWIEQTKLWGVYPDETFE